MASVKPTEDRVMAIEREGIESYKECHPTQQRWELEAKLLAYRCGWLPFDEIKIRKLEHELTGVLTTNGIQDSLAEALISADGPRSRNS